MKKIAMTVLVSSTVALMLGVGTVSASSARLGAQSDTWPGHMSSVPMQQITNPDKPGFTGKQFRECDGDGICYYYDCYETDNQSVCDLITWCNPGGACWPT